MVAREKDNIIMQISTFIFITKIFGGLLPKARFYYNNKKKQMKHYLLHLD